jgi:DNA repair protein RadC
MEEFMNKPKKILGNIELPRERAIKYGVNSLSTEELLAIIIGYGVKDLDCLTISRNLSSKLTNLRDLSTITIKELCQEKGIKEAKALNIIASIELGKRIVENKIERKSFIDKNYIYDLYSLKYLSYTQEVVFVVYLDDRHQLIKEEILNIGSSNSTSLSFSEIVKNYYKNSAYSFLLLHNHPNGDSQPSEDDDFTTSDILKMCASLNINFYDHLIIGESNYYSYKERKVIQRIK